MPASCSRSGIGAGRNRGRVHLKPRTSVSRVTLQSHIAPEPAPAVPGSVDYRLRRRRLLADVEAGVSHVPKPAMRTPTCCGRLGTQPRRWAAAARCAPTVISASSATFWAPDGQRRQVRALGMQNSNASHSEPGTSWPTRWRFAPSAAGTTSSGAIRWAPAD